MSRSREYGADQSGAELTQDPEGLASALERLDAVNKQLQAQRGGMFRRGRQPAQQPVPAAMAHLYTVSPLVGRRGPAIQHPPSHRRASPEVAQLPRRVATGPLGGHPIPVSPAPGPLPGAGHHPGRDPSVGPRHQSPPTRSGRERKNISPAWT